jgi:hypothetical protein
MAIIQLTENHRKRLKEYIGFLSDSKRFNRTTFGFLYNVVRLIEIILDDNEYDGDALVVEDIGLLKEEGQTYSDLLNRVEKLYTNMDDM